MWVILFSVLVTVVLVFLWRKKEIETKFFLIFLAVNLGGTGVSIVENLQYARQAVTELQRDSADDAGQLSMIVEEEGGQEYDISLNIPYKEYTEEEARAEIAEAMEDLDQVILGRNTSLEHVSYNLNLPQSLEDSPVSINWYSNHPDILGSDGVIHGDEEEGTEVVLMADLSLQDSTENYSRNLIVFPSEEEDSRAEQIALLAEKMNEENKKGVFYLPTEFRGSQIRWYRENGRKGIVLSCLALFAGIMWILRNRENRKTEQEKRNEQMLQDYPGLLSKIQLYMNAGLSMRRTFERIESSYQRQRMREGKEIRYAYEEISQLCAQMRSGKTEMEAYEEYGNRCKLPCYKGLALLLTQNLKRGGAGLLNQLERESAEAFENRKREAKMAGEKAGIKLLLPMSMMLVVVMGIVMIPAMMNL